MMKKKTLKKNSSNRKPISYFTEFRLDINLNKGNEGEGDGRGGEGRAWEGRAGERRGGELKCYRHTDIQTYRQTYIHTDPQTKRVLEEHSLLKREK